MIGGFLLQNSMRFVKISDKRKKESKLIYSFILTERWVFCEAKTSSRTDV